jgi:hypothetical protein
MYSLCMYELPSKVIVFPWSKSKQHGIAFFILGESFFGGCLLLYTVWYCTYKDDGGKYMNKTVQGKEAEKEKGKEE